MSTAEETSANKLVGDADTAVSSGSTDEVIDNSTGVAGTEKEGKHCSNGNEDNCSSGKEVDGKPKVEENGDTNNTTNTNERGHWDQTSKRVVIHNVLKFVRAKEVNKLATKWLAGHEDKIQIIKTKKPPKDNWVKVTLADESMVDPFIELINKGGEGGEAMVNGRGKPLFAKRADEFLTRDGGGRDDNRKRKGRDNDNDGRDNKRSKHQPRPIRILSTDEVRDAITPLWRLPYENQLDQKARDMVNKCAMKIVKEIKGKFRILEREAKRGQRKSVKVYDWVDQKRAIEMEQVVPSPLKYEYRNKCEFTIGYRLVQAEKEGGDAVGAALEGGEMKDGDTKDGELKVEESTDELKVEDAGSALKDSTDVKVEGAAPAESTSTDIQKIPAAGFLAQGWNGGVYPPHCLQNMPGWSCGLADIFNEFLPTSPIPPYDSKVHRGVWRTVTVRCSLRTRECMVIVLHAPAAGGAGKREDGSDDYSEAFEGEKKRLVEMLTRGVIPTPARDFPDDHVVSEIAEKEGSEEGIRVTSIYFQEYEGLSHPTPDHPVQHVFGKTTLDEKLGKCTFQISPGAFFQTNTEGAEVLYSIVVERIKEVTTDPKQTTLLDVCCGTGTIGLTCLKEGVVGKLVGVDIAEPAIEDAKVNAEKNGFTDKNTTQFIASAAEKVLPETMYNIPEDSPIVAVVDPARDGLHSVVIRTLRANEKIQRLVYVSCNPTGTLVRDAAMLCSPPTKKYPGRPFKPTISQPVDMFPSTKHCELVMAFDRMSREEFDKYHGTKSEEQA